MQAILCSCHSNVEQSAFFLKICVHIRLFVRNDPLIDVDEKYFLKLQALGTVKGREYDRIWIMLFFYRAGLLSAGGTPSDVLPTLPSS